MIKLDPHIFTDTGYRFRRNVYEQEDYWYWPIKKESVFNDFTLFNHDEFTSDLKTSNRILIAELWYRNEVNQLNHTRTVIQIEDFLGRIGGIFGIVYALLFWVFKHYISYEAKLRWIQKFYKFQFQSNHANKSSLEDILKENLKIDFQKISIIGSYIINYSPCKCCLKCFYKSNRQQLIRQMMKKGEEQL